MSGTQTPDRYPGEREEDSIKFIPQSEAPTVEGVMRYLSDGKFSLKDAVGNFDPRKGSGGLEYFEETSEQASYTTSTLFQDKVVLEPTTAPDGTYVLFYSFELTRTQPQACG